MSGDADTLARERSGSRFAKLNDSNYAFWSIRMEAELIRNDLWFNIIEMLVDRKDEKGVALSDAEFEARLQNALKGRSARTMAKSRAEMMLHVEQGQLAHMTSRDPREVWESLKEVHRPEGFATTVALRRRFLTALMKPGQSVTEWIGHIQEMAHEMRLSGITVTELDVISRSPLDFPLPMNQSLSPSIPYLKISSPSRSCPSAFSTTR